MNFKVLAAAVALLAICAEARTVGSDDGDLVDVSGKDLGLELQALSAGLDKVGAKTPPLEAVLDAAMKAVKDVQDLVKTTLQTAQSAARDAVTSTVQAAQNATQHAVDVWNQKLEDVLERSADDVAAAQQCLAQTQPTLPSVAAELQQDKQACVQNATTSASRALGQLQSLRGKAGELSNDAVLTSIHCANAVLDGKTYHCTNAVSELTKKVGSLVFEATKLAAGVTAQLTVQIPLQAAKCVGNAIRTRGAEATGVISAVAQCVDAIVNQGHGRVVGRR